MFICLTFLRNVINEDGGTPGFDVLAVLTIMLSAIKDCCACCSAFNDSFTEDVACKVQIVSLRANCFHHFKSILLDHSTLEVEIEKDC